jgi:hypothetical protein
MLTNLLNTWFICVGILLNMNTEIEAKPKQCVPIQIYKNVPERVALQVQLHKSVFEMAFRELA